MSEKISINARGKISSYCFDSTLGAVAVSYRDHDEVQIHQLATSEIKEISLVRGLESLSLSSNGKYLAAGGENTGLWLVDLDDGTTSELVEPSSSASGIRFSAVPRLSPDGQHLAVGYPQLTRIWQIHDRLHVDLRGDSQHYMNWPHWITDNLLARMSGTKNVPVTDSSGSQIAKLKNHKSAHRIASGYGWLLLDGHSLWKTSDWSLAAVLYGAPLFYAIRSSRYAYSATKNQVEEIDLDKLERKVIMDGEALGRVDIEIWKDRLWSIERTISQIDLVEIALR